VTINEFEVLLLWSPSRSRCVKTFEIEFADVNSLDKFERINNETVSFASFDFMSEYHKVEFLNQ
jgi:hypothetical protein